MKHILILFAIATTLASNAQFVEKHNYMCKGLPYDIFIMRQDSAQGISAKIVENKNGLSEENFWASITDTSFLAITASIVGDNCEPIGLIIDNKTEIKPINLNTSGTGNFYSISPNGVFYINTHHELGIVTSSSYNNAAGYICALQSGPCLVLDKQINSSFTKGSKNKFFRCGVGCFETKEGRFVIFAKSLIAVNFYDFANLFLSHFGCRIALNLESGKSSSMHLPTIKVQGNNSPGACRYLVITL